MTDVQIRPIGWGGRLRAAVASGNREYPPIMLIPSVGEYPIYDEKLYSVMTSDTVRVTAFERAVRSCAPGRTVLDIGTGADANWAITAAAAGATRVWAVEALPESAEQARKVIAEHGFSDVVTVLEGDSWNIELPERADVCVSETIGTIASSEGICAIFDDARRRLVRDGGIFIPHRAETVAIPFDFDAVLRGARPALMDEYAPYVERVFDSVGRAFELRLCWTEIPEIGRLADPVVVETLHLGAADHEYPATRSRARIRRPGTFGGVALGIRLWVSPRDELRIDSLVQQTSWLPVFVPADAERPRRIEVGDEFEIEFDANPSLDGIHPDYRLGLRFTGDAGDALRWDAKYLGAAGPRSNPFYRRLFADELPA
ncbi:hypothetical protein NDR87_10865 [Nocardia sp. CDC159]|uniref:Protein arginine N-methyltransferase 1 n=1 Tax=Nocardia pulmonis TaxID=2951408 RepID=A0A9X2E4G6_9NOCA|nr:MULTISPECIES: methyltransferase domain-containing protein [Nocardia]MCM6773972.1 hypothetical protein [Nocardia pulmonis]MCM6786859.1 hypothetical protein [Nocardia sp. CDC159]